MSDETQEPASDKSRVQRKRIDRKQTVKGKSKKNLHPARLKGLQNEDLVELLCVLEAEVQAKDMIISAMMNGEIGNALPLSHLLGDAQYATVVRSHEMQNNDDDDDDIWLGEPTAHLNHVVAYHQLVREQMQSMMQSLQDQHKMVLRQLEDEQQKHAIDTAQGDEVTYMLEKERERLTNEIEFEQGKLSKAEKERDKLLMILEKEREEQQNEFHLLVNDCKMFAKQLIDQAQKEEQLIKEIEQERRKNRVLSEVMVEQQKKFKEKIRLLEEQRNESEMKTKESRQINFQQSKHVQILEFELNQLRRHDVSSKDSSGSSENGDQFVQDEVKYGFSVANIYNPSRQEEDDSHDTLDMIITAEEFSKEGKTGTISKARTAKKSGSNLSSPAHSTERISASPVTAASEGVILKGPNLTSEEFQSRKIPPPTPPRVSSITAKSVPVLSTDLEGGFNISASNFVRSNSLGAESIKRRSPIDQSSRYERRQTMASSSDYYPVLVAVVTGYGWEYTKNDGLVQSNRVLDFLGKITVHPDSDWKMVTESANTLFLDKFPTRISKDIDQWITGLSLNSIQSYELGHHLWSLVEYPVEHQPWASCANIPDGLLLTIRLKDETTISCDSLAYSTTIPVSNLQEYCRLIQRYKNVLFLADDILEAKHFISCFSNWLTITEELRHRKSFVASVEETEISSPRELIKLLIDYGALVSSDHDQERPSTVILMDVDFAISEKFASEIFTWLGSRGNEESFYLSNGLSTNSGPYFLRDDVIVLAYATRQNLREFGQGMYRVFKMIDLPPSMSYLLQRWLRQKASQYSVMELDFKELDDWVLWISDVYRRTRTDLERLDIQLDLPDIGLFLSAPVDDAAKLTRWAEDLWMQHFQNIIEKSVETQVEEASKSQQELLIQVALKTFFENALLPGCPVRLEI